MTNCGDVYSQSQLSLCFAKGQEMVTPPQDVVDALVTLQASQEQLVTNQAKASSDASVATQAANTAASSAATVVVDMTTVHTNLQALITLLEADYGNHPAFKSLKKKCK